MKNQICSWDEDDYDSSKLASYCWWRSAARFDECAKFKFDPPNISGLTPRLRVLRELERLALVAHEGLNELRQKLFMYTCGDFWMPTGGISKEKMDIPPVITILLVGFSGSGKSSLVNLMYCVLGRSGLVPFTQTSSGKLFHNFFYSMWKCRKEFIILNLNRFFFFIWFLYCRRWFFFQLHDYVFGRAQCGEVNAKWVLCIWLQRIWLQESGWGSRGVVQLDERRGSP